MNYCDEVVYSPGIAAPISATAGCSLKSGVSPHRVPQPLDTARCSRFCSVLRSSHKFPGLERAAEVLPAGASGTPRLGRRRTTVVGEVEVEISGRRRRRDRRLLTVSIRYRPA